MSIKKEKSFVLGLASLLILFLESSAWAIPISFNVSQTPVDNDTIMEQLSKPKSELSEFLTLTWVRPGSDAVVGLKNSATDLVGNIGEGPGDAIDELVAISFMGLPPLKKVNSAFLRLDIGVGQIAGFSTEELLFADIFTDEGFMGNQRSTGFGRKEIFNAFGFDLGDNPANFVSVGDTATAVIDLMNISSAAGGTFDLANRLLRDGDLTVVYGDDAFIRGVSLIVSGEIPEPSSLILFGIGLTGFMGFSVPRKKTA